MGTEIVHGTTRRRFMGLLAAFTLHLRSAFAQDRNLTDSIVSSPQQVNGVACAKDGRVFVSLPRWIDDTFSVGVRQSDGSLGAYPGGTWNVWGPGLDPAAGFVCVNALHIDPRQPDRLWVVDAAAPSFGNIVQDGPKLVAIDLATNQVIRAYALGSDIVPTKGYLNDVRFTDGHAFLTDSGTGAIIVLDLNTGRARRLLSNHASTKAVRGRVPTVDGRRLASPSGAIPQVNVDGIELSYDRQWLLYAVPFGGWLWRVRNANLSDETLSTATLEKSIEQLGPLMAIGGMTAAPDGGLLLSDVEHHAIVHRAPNGALETVATSASLQWPDASALNTAGCLLVAASQVDHMPSFNGGLDTISRPFHVVTVPLSSAARTASRT